MGLSGRLVFSVYFPLAWGSMCFTFLREHKAETSQMNQAGQLWGQGTKTFATSALWR